VCGFIRGGLFFFIGDLVLSVNRKLSIRILDQTDENIAILLTNLLLY
jgi:hypothetical protein